MFVIETKCNKMIEKNLNLATSDIIQGTYPPF